MAYYFKQKQSICKDISPVIVRTVPADPFKGDMLMIEPVVQRVGRKAVDDSGIDWLHTVELITLDGQVVLDDEFVFLDVQYKRWPE